MDNIQAAMLLPQMGRLSAKLAERHRLARLYAELLADVPGVVLPTAPPGAVHARHLFPVWLPAERRDQVVTDLNKAGIGAVVNYRPVHLLAYFAHTYGYCRGDFPVAESIGDRTVSLPFYPGMQDEDLASVVSVLRTSLAAGSR